MKLVKLSLLGLSTTERETPTGAAMRVRDSPTNISSLGAAENEEQNQPKQIQTGTDKSRQSYCQIHPTCIN